MKSLRAGLTLRIGIVLVVVGGLCVLIGNWLAHRQNQAQMDYQMQQVARIVAGQPFPLTGQPLESASPPLSPQVNISHDEDDDLIVVVRDSAGRVLYASASNRQLPDRILPPIAAQGFADMRFGGEWYRVFVAGFAGRQIEVAQSAEAIREAEEGIALATLLPLVLLLPVLAVVIVFTIRRQLQPLHAAAQEVAARAPLSSEPLPVDHLPLEVQPFVAEINRLLGRLHEALEREQRFVTDAAHALRTPLTALQLQADVLEGARDASDHAARVADLRAGIRRIVILSEQLLTLARTQSAAGATDEKSELDPLLQEISAFYHAAAQARSVDLQVEAQSQAQVRSSRRRLTLILGNLIDNAVRHTRPGGTIRVSARIRDSRASIEISDEGEGLPPEELGHAFERFYRGADSDSGGSGLGLATVASLVRQVQGEVTLHNRPDRPGLVATVVLPLALA
jgi:two-component system, OmpR family, sensor kinase